MYYHLLPNVNSVFIQTRTDETTSTRFADVACVAPIWAEKRRLSVTIANTAHYLHHSLRVISCLASNLTWFPTSPNVQRSSPVA